MNFNSLPRQQMDTRQLQISSLLQNVMNIKEKYKDVYEVLWFDPLLNRTLCLTITLPPQFPQYPPVFRISPLVTHPWIDNAGIVTVNKKYGSNWNQYTSLANMTNEIIRELKTNNPKIAPQQYPSLSNSMPSISAMDNHRLYFSNPMSNPQLHTQSTISQGPINMPMNNQNSRMYNEKSLFDNTDLKDLENMSIDELKSFLSNDNKCMEYIKNKENIKKMYTVQAELIESNKKTAEKTLSCKENFERLKSELLEKQEQLKAERAKFEELMNEQKKYVSVYSPEQIFSCLQQGTSDLDDESEEIANNFLKGEITSEEFLIKYRESRTQYHLRAEKLELLTLNQQTIFSPNNK